MKILLSLLTVLLTLQAGAQTLPDIDQIKLDKQTDYKKAEPFVLLTANYLLTTASKKDDATRIKAGEFLVKWVAGTPDFSLKVSDYNDVTKGDNDMVGIYFAALTKYILENRAEAKDFKKVKLNTIIQMLDYCKVKSNNLRMSKTLKKYSDARDKGELEAML